MARRPSVYGAVLSAAEDAAYHELCAYTLAHGSPAFIHQHVVDAHAAQSATPDTKPIELTFALVGLHLHLDHRYTGREVQRAHMRLAQRKRAWPVWSQPDRRGAMTAAEVLAAPEGPERDAAIDSWCAAVWDAYRAHEPALRALLAEYGIP